MAAKTETIRARVEPKLKANVDKIFASLGLSATDAITMFYRQVEMHEGLPFSANIPNKKTLKAMKEVKERKNLIRHKSLQELRKAWGLD